MAHHKSAKKRIRSTARRAKAARQIRSHLKSLEKSLITFIRDNPSSTEGVKKLGPFYSALDKAVQKGVCHQNRVRRKKSQMALLFSAKKGASPSPQKL